MVRNGLFLGAAVEGGADVVLSPTDLTTHAFCVGMTGSGKTGLCSVLLEEVLAQGVPVIAVDPKGDLGNLCLALDPDSPEEFRAWLPPGSPPSLADSAASSLKAGLEANGLSREALLSYRQKRRARIVTPGATFGTPVNVLGSLAPSGDAEDAHEAAETVVRSLLGLLKIDADPVQSREFILLNALVSHAFSEGRALDLVELVRGVADPPFETVGALPLEIFYPQKERTKLMLALNALLASPSFAAWRQGEPLDLDRWLAGPQLTVFSVAHLDDAERLFAVALLLDRVKSWMRRQPGTGQLRAVIYLDEIFGYFPPHPADPPTKRPLLTLLKQARAFGVGVVLATQNPIDLDYKGLSNTGTWLVGRLQTEQDRARLRDGLTAAATSGGVSSPQVEALLGRLEKRVFLLHSVHRGSPQLFKSRYAYSFLRGPLGREEITRLAREGAPGSGVAPAAPSPASAPAPSKPSAAPVITDAALGPLYAASKSTGAPHLLVKCAVRFKVGRATTDESRLVLAFPLAKVGAMAEALEGDPQILAEDGSLSEAMPQGFVTEAGPAWLGSATEAKLQKVVKQRLPAKLEARLFSHEPTKLVSRPGEPKDAFLVRVHAAMAESKAVSTLQTKLATKRRALQQAQEQLAARKTEKWASVGSAVMDNLGLVFGRKRTISGVGGVLSKNRMESSAEDRVETLTAEVQQLEAELNAATVVTPNELHEQSVVPGPRDLAIFRVAIAFL